MLPSFSVICIFWVVKLLSANYKELIIINELICNVFVTENDATVSVWRPLFLLINLLNDIDKTDDYSVIYLVGSSSFHLKSISVDNKQTVNDTFQHKEAYKPVWIHIIHLLCCLHEQLHHFCLASVISSEWPKQTRRYHHSQTLAALVRAVMENPLMS